LFTIHAEQWFDRAHNIIFDILITSGIVGLLAYASIYAASFWTLYQSYRLKRQSLYAVLLLAVGLIAYVIQNLFVFDTLPTYLLFLTLLAFIATQAESLSDRACKILHTQKIANTIKRIAPIRMVLTIVITAGVFWVYVKVNMLPARANTLLTDAIVSQSQGSYHDAVRYFQESLVMDTNQKYEARQRYGELMLSNNLDKQFTKDEIAALYKEAIGYLEDSITTYGDDVQNHAYLLSLYRRAIPVDPSYLDRAIEVGKDALKKSPTRPTTYFLVAQLAMLQGTDAGAAYALQLMQQVVALAPNAPEVYLNLLNTQLSLGMQKEAEKTYQHLIGLSNWNNSVGNMRKLSEIYIAHHNYQRAIEVYQDVVSTGHDNAQDHIRLAALYYQIKEFAQAKEEATHVAELDPSLATQTKSFIEQIDQAMQSSS